MPEEIPPAVAEFMALMSMEPTPSLTPEETEAITGFHEQFMPFLTESRKYSSVPGKMNPDHKKELEAAVWNASTVEELEAATEALNAYNSSNLQRGFHIQRRMGLIAQEAANYLLAPFERAIAAHEQHIAIVKALEPALNNLGLSANTYLINLGAKQHVLNAGRYGCVQVIESDPKSASAHRRPASMAEALGYTLPT